MEEKNAAQHGKAFPLPSRSYWPGMLIGILILVCGIAIGAGGTIALLPYMMMGNLGPPARIAEEISTRISSSLSLSPEQQKMVHDILQAHHKELMAIRRDTKPRMDASMAKMKAGVGAVLTPAQKKIWDNNCESILFPRQGMFGGFPHPPGGMEDGGPGNGPGGPGGGHRGPEDNDDMGPPPGEGDEIFDMPPTDSSGHYTK